MKRIAFILVNITFALSLVAQESITMSQAQYEELLRRIERLEENQVIKEDTISIKEGAQRTKRLTIGGYGEAVMSRNFYSDSWQRYLYPERYWYGDVGGHGRFDLPHVTLFLGYDFGHGWSFGTEVEFEHGGVEAAVEMEADEAGEYENEIERGGEVFLEQFWVQKSFRQEANIRLGHIIVPVGLTNQYHDPLQFFTVYRPEGENCIIPCTWHQTGISFWGKYEKNGHAFRYEAQFLPGLDSDRFSSSGWIHDGSASPYEFKIANVYAGAFRLDYFSPVGLRLGLSGYVGNSFANSLTKNSRYKDCKGTILFGALDGVYDAHNLIIRGQVDYGHLSDSYEITTFNRTAMSSSSPSSKTAVAKAAFSGRVEVGYNFFGLNQILSLRGQKFYLFGLYEYYDPMFEVVKGYVDDAPQYERHRVAVGINYFPIKQVVIKAEYSQRFLNKPFNNEPSLSIGIAYSGLFCL